MRMLCGASQIMKLRMSPTTPCLLAVYPVAAPDPSPPRPDKPLVEEMRTIDPPSPRSIINGAIACTVFHTPTRFTMMVSTNARCGSGSSPRWELMPALATTMSGTPNRSRQTSTAAATSAGSRTSPVTAIISPPTASTSATVCCRSSAVASP